MKYNTISVNKLRAGDYIKSHGSVQSVGPYGTSSHSLLIVFVGEPDSPIHIDRLETVDVLDRTGNHYLLFQEEHDTPEFEFTAPDADEAADIAAMLPIRKDIQYDLYRQAAGALEWAGCVMIASAKARKGATA